MQERHHVSAARSDPPACETDLATGRKAAITGLVPRFFGEATIRAPMPRPSLRLRAERGALRALLASSPQLLRRISGPPPRNDRGDELDPQLAVLLRIAGLRRAIDPDERDVAHQRAAFERDAPVPDFSDEIVHRVEERYVPAHSGAMRVRIYEPEPGALRPACVYMHGGGFVLGSLDSHDGVCRRIAARARCVVIALDYRLAPENKFPGPSLDAIAGFRWVVLRARELGVDPSRIAVAGDSAGGNLAACIALAERSSSQAPCFQLLVYPVTDFTHATDSYRLFRQGYLLTADSMAWFKKQHLRDIAREERDPRGSIVMHDDVARVAPAYVLVAGFDPLRDEGERYAAKLEAAGVPVELRRAGSMIHGFFSMGGAIPAAREEIDRAIDALARGLAPR